MHFMYTIYTLCNLFLLLLTESNFALHFTRDDIIIMNMNYATSDVWRMFHSLVHFMTYYDNWSFKYTLFGAMYVD